MSENEIHGYILRISKEEWLDQVFRLNKYYPGVLRKYRSGTPILFAKKAEEGDSFIGYGIIDKMELLGEMNPEEEAYCLANNWKCAISFRKLTRFQRPLPIKETILRDDPRKGTFLHSAKLSEMQVNSILKAAESYQGTS